MPTPTNDDGTATALSNDTCQSIRPERYTAVPAGGPGPLLSSHAALIFLVAMVIGGVLAVLTYLSASNTAAAALAGVMGTGGSVPVLHTLIGR